MTLRAAALAGIAIALIVVACGDSTDDLGFTPQGSPSEPNSQPGVDIEGLVLKAFDEDTSQETCWEQLFGFGYDGTVASPEIERTTSLYVDRGLDSDGVTRLLDVEVSYVLTRRGLPYEDRVTYTVASMQDGRTIVFSGKSYSRSPSTGIDTYNLYRNNGLDLNCVHIHMQGFD